MSAQDPRGPEEHEAGGTPAIRQDFLLIAMKIISVRGTRFIGFCASASERHWNDALPAKPLWAMERDFRQCFRASNRQPLPRIGALAGSDYLASTSMHA